MQQKENERFEGFPDNLLYCIVAALKDRDLKCFFGGSSFNLPRKRRFDWKVYLEKVNND